MKQIYVASLCKNGVLGGWLSLGGEAVTYRTTKLTVSPQLRNLELPFSRLRAIRPRWLLVFPAVTFEMTDGQSWTFLVFARRRFLQALGRMGKF